MLGEHRVTGEIFAIKVLNKDTIIQNDDVECTMTERRILALSARHPFLTALCCSFQTQVYWLPPSHFSLNISIFRNAYF